MASRSRRRARLRWIVEKLVSRPAQPPLVHEIHPAALRFLGNHILRLALGAHKQHRPAVGSQIRDELLGDRKALRRLVQVEM
jgi:hypothetical protein